MPTPTSLSAATIAATTRPSCPTTSRSTTSTPTWRNSIGPVLYGQTIWHKDFDPANPRKLNLLGPAAQGPDSCPYAEFMKPAQNVREFWRPIDWLYYNLDNGRFDEWILEEYTRREAGMKQQAARIFAADAREARRRKVPAVCDEGGYFYPPLGSKFELRPPGTSMFELQVDLADQARLLGHDADHVLRGRASNLGRTPRGCGPSMAAFRRGRCWA